MFEPSQTERELHDLQLRDLQERRKREAERRWLWFIAAVLLAVALKVTGTI